MPRVPILQDIQIAQQAVSTPGYDTSGGMVANVISSELGKQNDFWNGKIKQQAVLDRAHKEMVDAVTLGSYQTELDNKLHVLQQEADKQPTGKASEWYVSQSRELINSYSGMIPDENIKFKVNEYGLRRLTDRQSSVMDSTQTRRAEEAKGQFLAASDSWVTAQGQTKTPDELLANLEQFETNNAAAGAVVYGAEGNRNIRKLQQQAVENYFSRVSRETPGLIPELLDSEMFDKYIAEDDKLKFYDRWKTIDQREQRELEKQQLYEQNDNFLTQKTDLELRLLDNNANENDIEKLHQELRSIKAPPNQIATVEAMKVQHARRLKAEEARAQGKTVVEENKQQSAGYTAKNRLLRDQVNNINKSLFNDPKNPNAIKGQAQGFFGTGGTKYAVSDKQLVDDRALVEVAYTTGAITPNEYSALTQRFDKAIGLRKATDQKTKTAITNKVRIIDNGSEFALTHGNDKYQQATIGRRYNEGLKELEKRDADFSNPKTVGTLEQLIRYYALNGTWPKKKKAK